METRACCFRVATPYEYVPLLARVIAQLVNDARIRNAM